MAERDKVIKTGQLTLPRILFLAVVGGVIVATVALGGIWLSIGYWLLTLSICGLLFLIAMDYGVQMDRVDLSAQPAQIAATSGPAAATEGARPPAVSEVRAKRRSSRPAKRRR